MIKFSKIKNKNKGSMSFEMQVLLFVVAVFVLWILTGGTNKQVEEKPFIAPFTDVVDGEPVYKNGYFPE